MKRKIILGLILGICFILGISIFYFVKTSKKSGNLYGQFLDNKENKFQYMDINWNSSVDEVQKKLPFEIEEVDIGSETSILYQSKETFDFDGNNGIANLEFIDDQLKTIKFEFSNLQDNYEDWFDTQYQALVKLYGKETEKKENESDLFDSQVYTWKKDDTVMQLILLTGDSINPAATFGIWIASA